MSYVTAVPEMLAAAATDVAAVGSAVRAAHLVAAAPTVAVIPAAADEVSAGIAHLFSQAAQEYHALAGRAAAFGEQFVQHLHASAGSYAATEAASAASLQHVNASAASIVSTIGALPGQLLDALTGIWNTLTTYAEFFGNVLYAVALIPPFLAYASAGLALLALGLSTFAVQFIGFAIMHFWQVLYEVAIIPPFLAYASAGLALLALDLLIAAVHSALGV
jgi:hypothetical protein